MSELTKKVEAIPFAVARYISIDEITQLCKATREKVKDALLELMANYHGNQDTSLVILNDGELWKLTTKEEYSNVIRKVVTETELSKSLLETLAVIAFKYPIKQSDLIRIRTDKGYEHLAELEKQGFITRQRYGRSRLIKLTDKFFEYFDLPHEKLQERFKGFQELAQRIEQKEDEIESKKQELETAAQAVKEQKDKDRRAMEQGVELIDDAGGEHVLENYEANGSIGSDNSEENDNTHTRKDSDSEVETGARTKTEDSKTRSLTDNGNSIEEHEKSESEKGNSESDAGDESQSDADDKSVDEK